jgi:hypothetical protein
MLKVKSIKYYKYSIQMRIILNFLIQICNIVKLDLDEHKGKYNILSELKY